MKKRIRINGILIFLTAGFILVFPKFFLRLGQHSFLSYIAEIIGFSFVLFGLLIRISARGYKAEKSKQGYALVKEGPYGLVRNPMYLGIALIGLGVVLLFFKWWAAVFFVLIFTVRYILLIFKEEKILILKFKDEYKSYIKKTPRLFPGIKDILKRDLKDILPLRLSWAKKEIVSIIILIAGVFILKFWENIYTMGIVSYAADELIFFVMVIIVFLSVSIYLRYEKR